MDAQGGGSRRTGPVTRCKFFRRYSAARAKRGSRRFKRRVVVLPTPWMAHRAQACVPAKKSHRAPPVLVPRASIDSLARTKSAVGAVSWGMRALFVVVIVAAASVALSRHSRERRNHRRRSHSAPPRPRLRRHRPPRPRRLPRATPLIPVEGAPSAGGVAGGARARSAGPSRPHEKRWPETARRSLSVQGVACASRVGRAPRRQDPPHCAP